MQGGRKGKKISTSEIIGKLSIRHKVVLIIMFVSVTTMLLAGGIFITYEWFFFRERMVNDLSAQAKMLADNSIGALSFDDSKDAEEVLRSLQAKKPIVFACIYRIDGTIFATYQRKGFRLETTLPKPQKDGYHFNRNSLVVFKPIILNNQSIGTVYLHSDLSEQSAFIKQSAIAFTLMILLSSIFIYALSSKIQKVISMPILSLAETAGEITAKKDYSVRADKKSEDEVGHLIDSFNNMLEQIQKRDDDLRESEKRYRTLFESANDAIFILQNNLFINCNQKALEMFGCKREEIINQSLYKIFPPTQPDSKNSINKSLEKTEAAFNGIPQFFEWKHQKFDGTLFDAEVNLNVIELSTGKYMQAIVRNITVRKQAEKELEKHRMHLEKMIKERTAELHSAQEELLRKQRLADIGQLTATVSHELRNPLGSIRNSLSVIQRLAGKDNPMMKSALGITDRGISRCDNIINELLDFTRIRQLNLESTDIDAWLAEVLDDYRHASEIDLVHNPGAGVEILCDREYLLRAALNVLNNACEAVTAKEGLQVFSRTPRVSISTRTLDNCVEIEIADNGFGMSDEQQGKIFEPLFSTKSFGVGLGLSVVSQIMKQHGGSVHIDSEPGQGTRVRLLLPLYHIKNKAVIREA